MKSTDELLKQIRELNIDEFRKEESFDKIGIGEYLSQLLDSFRLVVLNADHALCL